MATAASRKKTVPDKSVDSGQSIMNRLVEWLHTAPIGPAPGEKKGKKSSARGAPPVEAPPPVQRWDVYQKIWGEGFTHPGGSDYALELVKPFNLKPAMTVLDLAAGLGGGAREMVNAFDMWVTCMEPDAELAAVGKAISVRKGADNRAPMSDYKLDELKLPAGKFDCILLREALHLFTHKAETLKTIKQALKPNGQIILTDFITLDRTSRTSEFQKWQSLGPLKPDPWTKAECVQALKDLEFTVHIIREESSLYRNLVLKGWANFMATLNRAELSREFLKILVVEMERWFQLNRALEKGELTFPRLHLSCPPLRLPSDP